MVPGFTAKEIKPTKTVGQRLKAARHKKELALDQAERLTKVKLKYLEALEEDRHDLLPTEVYSLGFLRCYGEVLGLNTIKLLEQYRTERQAFQSVRKHGPQALAPARRLASPPLVITPRGLMALASVLLVSGLIAYLISGIHAFLAPPALTINQPAADSRLTTQTVVVSGTTDPSVSLTINGELVTVDSQGNFSREIALAPGLNNIEVNAVNRIGKANRQVRKLLADYRVESSPSPIPSLSPSSPISPSPSPSSAGLTLPQATRSTQPLASPSIKE